VYPDALVIQTHHAPRRIIASVCSLNEQASAGWSTASRGPVIDRSQLELSARGAEKFLQGRRRYEPAQFCDVPRGFRHRPDRQPSSTTASSSRSRRARR
jgi:Sulfotransferase family